MNIIRRNQLTGFYMNHVDDILIFSERFDELVQHTGRLPEALENEGFRLDIESARGVKHSAESIFALIARGESSRLLLSIAAEEASISYQRAFRIRFSLTSLITILYIISQSLIQFKIESRVFFRNENDELLTPLYVKDILILSKA